jgi:DNA-binding winged helix-turn-helix (wHTH) protein
VGAGPETGASSVRYRFGEFVLSPPRRLLLRGGVPVPLIPRYFDLLVLLVGERHRAVHRQEIFDRVWADVIVSDGALSQAVRALRRALGDDSRAPVFIRTVSRHGYQFVRDDVGEEPDAPLADRPPVVPNERTPPAVGGGETDGDDARVEAERFEDLLERLTASGRYADATAEERREAAELLHAFGTGEALSRLGRRPRHAEARALLRDARWDVPGAAPVPLLSAPEPAAAIGALVRLRLRRALGLARSRWAVASAGGALAGAAAGLAGGLALLLVPASPARPTVPGALAAVGALAGMAGAAGIGGGLAAAEALARSARGLALTLCGAAAGAATGLVANLVATWLLEGIFGASAEVGGAREGLALGAAWGLGYALTTRRLEGGGMATPHGAARARAALVTGLCCSIASVVTALGGGRLVGASLDAIATSFQGSQVGLGPLAELLGDTQLRPMTRASVAAFEGFAFGTGLVTGLTHRPRSRERGRSTGA